jgi:hypothetical protein
MFQVQVFSRQKAVVIYCMRHIKTHVNDFVRRIRLLTPLALQKLFQLRVAVVNVHGFSARGGILIKD